RSLGRVSSLAFDERRRGPAVPRSSAAGETATAPPAATTPGVASASAIPATRTATGASRGAASKATAPAIRPPGRASRTRVPGCPGRLRGLEGLGRAVVHGRPASIVVLLPTAARVPVDGAVVVGVVVVAHVCRAGRLTAGTRDLPVPRAFLLPRVRVASGHR